MPRTARPTIRATTCRTVQKCPSSSPTPVPRFRLPSRTPLPIKPIRPRSIMTPPAGTLEILSDGTDTAPAPPDLPADKVSAAEPGPEPQGAEPGAEPSSGPEPGPEPGRESGPESGPEPAPEPPRDGSVADGSSAACANATPLTGGNASTGSFGTTNAFCFVTCDSMQYGWGCDSFTEATRTVAVNGTSVTCGGTLPARKSGYYYFEIAAGGHTWDAIHWSGTAATSCPAPAGGFSP